MLLRRITEHVKAQNWTAVALDFVIVVVGVFIGIQVSNWNEVRKERQREDHYLQRLDAEFDVVRERLSDGSATFEQSIRDIDMLLKTRRQHEQAPGTVDAADELLADAVGNITAGRVPAASPATFREMVARGALESLSSEELRHALFAFDEFSGVAREGWRTLRDEHREAANAIWGFVDVSAPEDETDDSDFVFVSFNREKFFNSPEIQEHLNILLRAQSNQRGFVSRQLQLAEEIEVIIAAERAQ